MTDDIHPGHFAIFGFDGKTPDKEFLRLIKKSPPAGFLLLEKNYGSPEQLRSLISNLKEIVGEDALFAVDQEPGRVQRFKEGFPLSRIPSDYVKEKLFREFRDWCAGTASLLRDTGVNLNLAPVLDIGSGMDINPALAGRIFGNDPDVVGEYADIFIKEHRKYGILSCGKHFPGLGAAVLDPHLRLSTSGEPLGQFENLYWKTFESAAKSGVDMMMTTHLKASSIDPLNPATYSRKTVDFLRERIGFAGPVLSDDLAMGGAGDKASIADLAGNAVMAGHNLLIVSGTLELQETVLDSLRNRYAHDEMFAKIAVDNEEIIQQIRDKINP